MKPLRERDRPYVVPTLSTARGLAAPSGLMADPRDRIGLSAPIEPPRQRRLPTARLAVFSVVGVTGGLAILFSTLKAIGLIG